MSKRYFLYKDTDGNYVGVKQMRELTKEDKIHGLLKSIVQLSEKAKIETLPFYKENTKQFHCGFHESIEEIKIWQEEQIFITDSKSKITPIYRSENGVTHEAYSLF